MLPFTLVTDEILLGTNVTDLPSIVDSLPTLEILSKLQNLPNLSDYDIDENVEPDINCNYYNVPDLQSLVTSSKDLSVLHMNIRSLPLHFDELLTLLGNIGIDFQLIGLTEIKDSVDSPISTNIDIPGYKFHHTPSQSAAGGVGIYVRSNLDANKRLDLCSSTCEFESVWIEIENAKSKNILCCCAYRHPSSDINSFLDHMQETLSKIANENKIAIIMGDFNINLLNFENHTLSSDFINTMFSNHFQPLILQPTRVTDSTSTLIDNIFSNDLSCKVISGNILVQISDHFPQFSIFNNSAPIYDNSSYFVYNYKKFDEARFLDDYQKMDFAFLNADDSTVNHKFDEFLTNLNQLVDKHCPKMKLNKKALKLRNKPWINNHIQRMMRIRDRIFQQFKQTESPEVYAQYKQFRNRVVNEIRNNKKTYFQNYFTENKSNMKLLWKGIRSVIKMKSNSGETNSIPFLTNDDGSKITDPSSIANNFNDYFINVASKITGKIPRNPNSPLRYLASANDSSFFISPTVPDEVSSVIQSLKKSKSSGPNSIPVKLLKMLGPLISTQLSQIINESFLTGIFPDKLKIAKVIPIFKKGDASKNSNYRPISLLSVFSKIFEKIMHERLYNFLELHEILFQMQFGFRNGHSTDHALISLSERIKSTIDSNRVGCGIFIDLQKAFDTVNHNILLQKLDHYGIRGSSLQWFESYLTGRLQYVSINNHSSSLGKVTCGVPQGSVLGPLLFLIYINDLPNVSKLLSFFLFADDTNIYFETENITKLQCKINKELLKVKSWLEVNKLVLNIQKTNYVVFHSPRKKLPEHILIKFGKNSVTRSRYVKFLGVLMDQHLSWKFHISELTKKLSRTSGIFSKIRHLLPLDILKNLYFSIFSSFLSYGSSTWGLSYDTYLEPLFMLQKKVLRSISFQPFFSPSTPIFFSLKILKLKDMIHHDILKFVYKSLNGLSPSHFHNYFQLSNTVHSHETRQAARGDIFQSIRNTFFYGLRSIKYFGAKLWNGIPTFIKMSVSFNIFKSKLKEFLVNGYGL